MTHTTTTQLLTLDQVCAEWGLHGDMADPVRWLRNQILSGRITARKIGHHWRMSRADMAAALDTFANTPTRGEPQPDHDQSAVSRRRHCLTVAQWPSTTASPAAGPNTSHQPAAPSSPAAPKR